MSNVALSISLVLEYINYKKITTEQYKKMI